MWFMGSIHISSLDCFKFNNFTEKLIELVCFEAIFSGAVPDGLTETRESCIIRPMLLQFRTLFRLFQTSLPYDLSSSLCMSMYEREIEIE